MSRIQSSVGLVTGIPIEETVDKLMTIAARPRDLLTERTKLLNSERLAVSQLTSLLLAFQFETTQLGKASLFNTKAVSSSDPDALSASVAAVANPAVGSYVFTPIQTATSQQFVSQSFSSGAELGAGSFTISGGVISGTDGSDSVMITIEESDTLDDVVEAINALDSGVTASLLNDGTGERLALSVDKSGSANTVLVDTGGSPFVLEEISPAQDAQIRYGTSESSSVVISSSTNEFAGVVDGIDLTIHEVAQEPVTVRVEATNAALTTAIGEFAAAYNSIRNKLDELTSFDAEALTTGVLFGTREALRLESDLARIITGPFFGVGNITSLEAVGISLNKDTGQMELDEEKLAAALVNDPAAVEQLFTHETLGAAKKLDTAIEQLAGESTSLLESRTKTLTNIIENNTDRITTMDERLARQREVLLGQFALLESTVARMQESLAALSSLQVIPPIRSTRNS